MDATSATSPQPHVPDESRPTRFTGRIVIGLAIICVGVLFLLDAFDVPGIGDIWHYVGRLWPAVFVLIGVSKLAGGRGNRERIGGFIWLLIGVALLANNFDLITFNVWRAFWPALLILFGLSMLSRATSPRFVYRVGRRNRDGSVVQGPPADDSSRTSAFAIMSGVTRRVSSPDFQGGDATAVMGGCEIDLRQSNIITGPAVFDVYALMGGIEIYVPGDWTVRNEGVPLLGSIVDARKDTAGNPSKVLVIRGTALMGGVEIKN